MADADPAGQTIATGSESTFSVLVPDDGHYTLTLTVTDDDGATATGSIVIDVHERCARAAGRGHDRQRRLIRW